LLLPQVASLFQIEQVLASGLVNDAVLATVGLDGILCARVAKRMYQERPLSVIDVLASSQEQLHLLQFLALAVEVGIEVLRCFSDDFQLVEEPLEGFRSLSQEGLQGSLGVGRSRRDLHEGSELLI
jgi:hypothetical protein